MIEIVTDVCTVCKHVRKFAKGSEREKQKICGNCWNWEKSE